MSWGKQGSCGSSKGALELNDEQCWSKQTKSETEKKENRVCEKKILSTWSKILNENQNHLLSISIYSKWVYVFAILSYMCKRKIYQWLPIVYLAKWLSF